ncbi:hypothetical protein [Spirosoma panaciterrae]|uniref:hypothetical protein n=1 Tax=Spirosoma panaciterrae TaxID=496058 RepID=UPI0003673AC4|nr:hypothetical protein [Spirosoma panaciterrae]
MNLSERQQKAIADLLNSSDIQAVDFFHEQELRSETIKQVVRDRMALLCYGHITPNSWKKDASFESLKTVAAHKGISLGKAFRQGYNTALFLALAELYPNQSEDISELQSLFWELHYSDCRRNVSKVIQYFSDSEKALLQVSDVVDWQMKDDTLYALLASEKSLGQQSIALAKAGKPVNIDHLIGKYFVEQYCLTQYRHNQDELGNLKPTHPRGRVLEILFQWRCSDGSQDPQIAEFNITDYLFKKLSKTAGANPNVPLSEQDVDEHILEQNKAKLWKELIREISREDKPLRLTTHLGAYLSGIRSLQWSPTFTSSQDFQLPFDTVFTIKEPQKRSKSPSNQDNTEKDSNQALTHSESDSTESDTTDTASNTHNSITEVVRNKEAQLTEEEDYERVHDYLKGKLIAYTHQVFYEEMLPIERILLAIYYNKTEYLEVIALSNDSFKEYKNRMGTFAEKGLEPESFMAAQFLPFERLRKTGGNYFSTDVQSFRNSRTEVFNSFKREVKKLMLGLDREPYWEL